NEKLPAPVVIGYGNEISKRLHQWIRRWVNLVIPAQAQADAAENQQHPKKVKHPMETGDQADPGADEDAPQDKRADDAPEQNPMLLLVGHREVFENHQEDEKVIDTEGYFQDITGNELQSYLMPLP